jgi:hypothetical protein
MSERLDSVLRDVRPGRENRPVSRLGLEIVVAVVTVLTVLSAASSFPRRSRESR